MGTYLVFFLILLICSYDDLSRTRSRSNALFNALYLVFSFLLIFRYGQGTDYFGYEGNYDVIDISNFYLLNDFGFTLVGVLFKSMGFPFEVFSVFINLVIAVLFYFLIIRNSNHPIFALFVIYCLFYFPVISSAMRQALTIGIFGAFMMPQLRNGKVKKSYYILGIVFSIFHVSILITLFFPLLRRFNIYKDIIPILIGCLLLALFGSTIIAKAPILSERGELYLEEESGSSLMALLSRILLIIPILFVKKKNASDYRNDFQFSILYFMAYLATWSLPLIAGRLLVYMRLFYVPAWEGSIHNNKLKKTSAIMLILVALCFMYFKEINTAIDQGGYVGCNILTFPYVSVFNEDEIYIYRTIF